MVFRPRIDRYCPCLTAQPVPGRNGADYPRPRPGRGDRRRGLWIARSDGSWGTLDRPDPETGTPQRHEIAPPVRRALPSGVTGDCGRCRRPGLGISTTHPFLGLFEPFLPLVFALDLSAWSKLSSSGSHVTRRWRRQSRANSSLKANSLLAGKIQGTSSILASGVRITGSKLRSGSMPYRQIPYATEQGINCAIAGN